LYPPGKIDQRLSNFSASHLYLRWERSGGNTVVSHYIVIINGHQEQTFGNFPEIYWDRKLNPGSTYNVTIYAVSHGTVFGYPWYGSRNSEPVVDWIEIDQILFHGHTYMSFGERDEVLKGDEVISPYLKIPTKLFIGDGSHEGFNYVVVGSNGVIGLGEEFNNFAIKEINTEEVKDRQIICPFWTDLLTLKTKGSIYYRTYQSGKGAENDLFIGKANDLIRLQFKDFPEFKATWLLKVTWVNMTLFGDRSQVDSVTFQCLLITNGEDTFTVINHIDVDLKPVLEKKITLGYQYKTFFVKNPFSNKDAAFQMSENPGNRGIRGFWIYKMTTGIPPNKDERECNYWYTKNLREKTNGLLSPVLNQIECACDSRLLRFDPRYAINRFDRKNRVLCFASMTIGRNAECCYRMHGSINSLSTLERSRPVAGTLLKYNPFFERQLYSQSDLKPKEACCNSGHCDWYYEVRPIPWCYWRSPFQPGVNFGDPHILTLDGKNYTFNGYGEYTMMKINKDSVRFKFQARTDLATTANGTTTNATIFSAFVAEDQTGSKVQIEMTRDKQNMIIKVNGRDLTRDFENVNYTFLTRNLSVRWENQTISASFLDSSIILKVSLGVRFLISETIVDRTYMGFTRGLMGNFDGDINNDFILPNETILDKNATKTERDIYYKFGQQWLVNEESIFHYDKGLTNKDFSHPEFEPLFLDETNEEALENAKKKCGVNPSQACIFDYLATGDIALAGSSGTEETISISEIKLIENETPRISGNTSVQVEVGKVVELWFNASDDSKEMPKYNILKSPEDFYLNTTSGEAMWTPKSTNISEISLSVVDELGAESPSLDVEITLCGGCQNEGRCDYLNAKLTENDRFKLALCDCETGYSGDKCEIDTNGCFGGPCPLGRNCTDLTPEEEKRLGRAYNCSDCPPGFEEVGHKCEDINECRNGNTSVCDLTSETCENTEGSFLCTCIPGYRKENETCRDIDECLELTSGCEQKCVNILGSFVCQCFPGFSLNKDNTSCNKTDENQCKDISVSCEYACNTTTGSCICPIGYQLHKNNQSCIDVNECEATPFPCEQNCSNINGSFQCFCRQGYALNADKVSCTECKEPYYGENCSQICTCGPGMDKCNPVSGCDCLEGWAGETCSDDIDECKSNQSICGFDKVCQNLEGSYICNCREGFQRVGDNCEDIDECSDLSLNDCPENTVCKNLYGNYTCLCKEGFQKQGSVCEDVDECTQNIDDCSQICSNTEGGYNCECEFGYSLQNDRRNCEKVSDICTLFPELNCSYGCILRQESSLYNGSCFCKSGFELDIDNSTCKDIDECKMFGTCEHNCTNTDGSFECGCNIGHTLQNDGKSCEVCIDGFYGDKCLKECRCGPGSERCDHINGCVCKTGWTGESCNQDINECNNTVSPCPGSNETCINNDGSYTCVCKDGFQNSTNGCKECENGYYGRGCDLQCLCDTNNTDSCDSMNGFCSCKEGWEGTYCSNDINECLNSSICGNIPYCLNLNGSFSCHCEDGFFLDGGLCVGCPLKKYGQNCSSICTCEFNNTQSCEKQNGTCNCKAGWQGKNCTEDIPECTNNPYICGNNSSCNETQGSYSCICDIGFEMSSTQNCTKCSDLTFGDQCSETCSCSIVGTIDCNDVTGFCTCKDGWNGTNCEFTNECETGASNCHMNATCWDTIDSYNCSCNIGFYGDGINCTECSDTTFGDQCSETCSCNVVGSIDCDDKTGYCTCKDGWNGSKCEFTNECEAGANNCHKNASCQDTKDSYNCSCNVGFYGDGVNCTECSDNTFGNQCSETCSCNVVGFIDCDDITGYCTCKDGWNGNHCEFTNECEAGANNCHKNASCQDTKDSYNCSCNVGFYGDGINCTECSDTTFGDQCSETCSCNVVGSIDCDDITGYCTCKDGWNGNHCEFTNECEAGANNCHKNASCQDTKDSYNCSCNVGFHGDGIHCTECSDTTFGDQCSETCSCNVVGSIDCDDITGYCTCKDGWNGSNCEFTSECKTGTNNCHKNASCQDTKDSYNCSCNEGFYGDGINCTECSDITFGDQCSETCSCNMIGSIDCDDITGYCTCKDGWNGANCQFTDECNTGANNCHMNASCQDTLDSYNCSCNVGFYGGGINCTACGPKAYGMQCSKQCPCIAENTNDCNDITGACVCKDKWKGTNCEVHVDDCLNGTAVCDPTTQHCVLQIGTDSYFCSCRYGLNATSGICLSPKPPYITNSREEVKFKAETTLMVDVTQQEFEEKTTNITDNVFQMLEDHFKKTMRGFKSLIILSLSLGSLNVEYEVVVYKNTSSGEQTSEYVKASKELLSKSVIIESLGKNASVSSVKMSNENGKDIVLNTSSSQCAVLQHLYPCSDGQDCVETSGVAMCLGRKKENENLSLILGLGIGIPFLLAALAIMAIVYVYCQRRSQKRNESNQCDLNRSSIPVRYGSWGPKSMFYPWMHETEERKALHSQVVVSPYERNVPQVNNKIVSKTKATIYKNHIWNG
ncbi:protein eyes shut homolog, partial [Saccostrea cucullata]|uniref:protein eyes shut homolog n=1 Tax=Saccostrea cuccullata TaxID=36930 RepID=UPI002ED4C3FC